MKTIHVILALVFATLFVSVFSFASEGAEVERKVQIKIDRDGEAIDIEADDMDVGETRQIYTESGKKVLLTRTEEGFDLDVDGKEIDIDIPHGDHHSVFMHGGDAAKVIVHKLSDGGEDHRYAFILGDDEDHGEHTWIEHAGEDGETIIIERVDAAEHLQESGVLDDLDEETRAKILDTLREIEPKARIHKKVMVEVRDEIHEHN